MFFFVFFADMRDARKALAEGQSPYEFLYKGGKVCTRAKETLEKAKDCISKELVWKVRMSLVERTSIGWPRYFEQIDDVSNPFLVEFCRYVGRLQGSCVSCVHPPEDGGK